MTASWSHKITASDVPESGAHFDLVADDAARAAIASTAGLRELPRLTASFDVTRSGADGLHVIGEVNASVGQNCVVTLEPIDSDISEPVDVRYSPDGAATMEDDQGEAVIDFSQDDPPEAMIGGEIDLGAIATEFLLLAIDPYPRKEGALFEPRIVGDPEVSPFAALASLKKKTGEN